jgi:hypothetical protein
LHQVQLTLAEISDSDNCIDVWRKRHTQNHEMKVLSITFCVLVMCTLMAGSGAGPEITMDALILELEHGKTASQIVHQVYAGEGKGACCTLAITCESQRWKSQVASKPRASRQEFDAIERDATACCRTSMCNDLKSEFPCLWLPFSSVAVTVRWILRLEQLQMV